MPRHGETSTPVPSGTVRAHDVARWCAGNGWPVHPLAPGRKTPAANCPTCREAGHHSPRGCPCLPAGRWCHGFRAATTDLARIDTWWGTNPAMGVGVACGPAGLVVLDVDAHSAEVPDRSRLLPGIPIHERVDLTGLGSGFDTLALLAAYRSQPDPAKDETTLRVRTPSGGLHIWYRNPRPDTRYRSSTGSSSKVALAWQVDIRADNGYIVAPTNRTLHGSYAPVGDARQPAPLPAWLADELARTGHTGGQAAAGAPAGIATSPPASPPAGIPSVAPSTTPEALSASLTPRSVPNPRLRIRRAPRTAQRLLEPLLAEVAACAATPQGASFTEKLNRAAYTAGGLVAGGHLTEPQVRDLLAEAAGRARPHQPQRNSTIIDSGLAAGATRPLNPQGRP
ncbi:bifunctional DNA primase/polymerase [Streptomyces sp. NPDC091272]|uniref:bifunctional DNA primase/polymerase n=1 Tax=Streptomyces sp. NPDC091272 TaxID=3365981 RepID=UPI0037FB8856